MTVSILTVALRHESDIVAARQRARQLAGLLGFEGQDQTRIATAVSEIARNAFVYARGGRIEFSVEGRTPPQVFAISVSDEGPGIKDLQAILGGRYQSSTGMGLGIIGARRLMDRFQIESTPGRGTTVWLRKLFSRRARLLSPKAVAQLAADLAQRRPESPLEEVQQQNRELLWTLDELRARQDELQRLNRELEDTNRGVVALYAELDEKADHLRRADEMKTRFLSNMSHEFRTPLNSILALSQLLLARMDGDLSPEQERQVGYIRKAADELSELVNDLLDLAKVEAGKIVVRPVEFEVKNLFGALRGMLRPLLVNESVSLVFEEPEGVPTLFTDEAKVSQILRNFISNALKFTEKGEVSVSARLDDDSEVVVFSVADTGIGIAAEDQERIFQEFGQLDSPLQRRVKGTGLGLPLTRKLAELLGGAVGLTSAPGLGSTFTATIPVVYRTTTPIEEEPSVTADIDPSAATVLVVEDDPADALLYEKFFRGTAYRAINVSTVQAARHALGTVLPRAIILDIMLSTGDTWNLLAELKTSDATRHVPVLVVTAVEDRQKGLSLGADGYALKPLDRTWLLGQLDRLTGAQRGPHVLVIDDDEISRYLLRTALERDGLEVVEAASGLEGIKLALESPPAAILLDLVMPGTSGFEVLDHLKASPVTRDVPVVVVSSQNLNDQDRDRLASRVAGIVSKGVTADGSHLRTIARVLTELRS